ncbi:MAG: SH3 domain-containing protein [Desulfobacteraceae bacterium]|jgi:type II secretory pathway component GspD/PulD (secretin)
MFKKALIVLLFIGYLCALPWHAKAVEIKWPPKKYSHISEEQPVDEFLRNFFSSMGMSVSISPQLAGHRVSGKFDSITEKVFQQIAGAFSLIWYYDGQVVYIYPANEAKSKLLELRNLSVRKIEQRLNRMHIIDRRFPPKYHYNDKMIYVSGPEYYVSLIEKTIRILEQKDQGGPDGGTQGNFEPDLVMNARVNVTAEHVAVRAGPGMHHSVRCQEKEGTVLIILAEADQWLYVRMPAGGAGWVPASATARSADCGSGCKDDVPHKEIVVKEISIQQSLPAITPDGPAMMPDMYESIEPLQPVDIQ